MAVKAAKRCISENMGPRGDLEQDGYYRAVLQHRNSPQQDTRLSPAQILFGHQLKDFIPVLPGKYRPHQEWGLIQEYRDRALARRLGADGSKLEKAHLGTWTSGGGF